MQDCIFCKLANGEIPTRKVYEDDRVAAFFDANPQAPVHILVVPKAHVADMPECVEKLPGVAEHMLAVAAQIAREQGLSQDGFRIVMNTGKGAGQTVFHFHMHILGGQRLSDHMA